VDTIDSALAQADRAWRKYGVGGADRAALAADLRCDLRAAEADGFGPAQLLGPDIPAFARRLADEAGVARVPAESGRLIGIALAGAAAGGGIGLALLTTMYPMLIRLADRPRSLGLPVQVAVVAYYGLPALVVVTAAVVAVRVLLPDVPRIRETGRAMAVLLPLAGILVTPLTMAFAWSTGYSTAPQVLIIEIALVVGALTGATALARRWALRERHRLVEAASV